eukprot:TRINITY_DN32007_c0_g1_i1.p2 TRINITY_DN32007_c0_g1~~TRINITY_DN32007_c0_g1_i1.p2  ORF type:complete len:160 (+),score=43.25 TRINITY_DN32007_c0_g1_i1:75-554(+)
MMLGAALRPGLALSRAALVGRQLQQQRWATRAPIGITELRKGMIYLSDGKYYEVKEWKSARTGRGAAAYTVSHEDLETGKTNDTKYGAGAKFTRVEPDKKTLALMYLERENNKAVLADEDYNEIEVPLERFGSSPPQEGNKVVMWHDDDGSIVKVAVMK